MGRDDEEIYFAADVVVYGREDDGDDTADRKTGYARPVYIP